ncbi:MAG: CxxC-x17-CxxC domain-containing protein [Candidatus Woesearchaeota archaeon]
MSFGNFRGNFEQRKMYKAICSDCGKECEVPFKPTEGKPVYCKECYQKRRKF